MIEKKKTKELKMSADQFQVNEKGELVIKDKEISNLIASQMDDVKPEEAGGISVGVTVGVR